MPSERVNRFFPWHPWRACLLLLAACALPGTAMAQHGALLRQEIADALVVADADRLQPFRWEHEPALIALYFGADWCGPCHAFVPALIQVRDALRRAGADTEVVYVSQDTSVKQMRRYMRQQHMPWPAIDARHAEAIPALRRLAGRAPPNLVLLNSAGDVLASSWQGNRYLGPAEVLKQWLAAAQSGLATPSTPISAGQH